MIGRRSRDGQPPHPFENILQCVMLPWPHGGWPSDKGIGFRVEGLGFRV